MKTYGWLFRAPQAFLVGYQMARAKGYSRWDSLWFGKVSAFVYKLAWWAKEKPNDKGL